MKNILHPVLLFLVLVLAFPSCKEEAPFINYEEKKSASDTTYIDPAPVTAQAKEVLLEDISGVSCPNCPDAAVIAKNLHTQFGEKLHVMTIQPFIQDVVTKPTSETHNDNRTQEGTTIVNETGIPPSLPSGYVDRKIYSPNTTVIADRFNWGTYVQQEVNLTTPLNITLAKKYDDASRILTIDVMVQYTDSMSDSNYLSIALLEDSVIDGQEYPTYVEPAYVHMHLLRKMITNALGDQLSGSLVKGRVFKKEYIYTMPGSFNHINLKVLAYVHKDAAKKEIIHAKEIDVE